MIDAPNPRVERAWSAGAAALLVVSVLLCASGCLFRVNKPERCGETSPICPNGQSCQNGVCRSADGSMTKDADTLRDAARDLAHEGTTSDGTLLVDLGNTAGDLSHPTGSFSDPRQVPEFASVTYGSPSLTQDMLEIYLDHFDRASRIYSAKRASVTSKWSVPQEISELGGNVDAGSLMVAAPEVSADGLTLYFGRGDSWPGLDIYVSKRSSRSAPWGSPAKVSELSSAESETGPALSADLLTIVFTRGPQGSKNLYIANRATKEDAWETPKPLALNLSNNDESDAWISADKKVLYFTSNRPGVGRQDIWRASRSDPTGYFAKPTLVDGLNTTVTETDPWLSPDERTVFFARIPDPAQGESYIFTATR